MLTPWFVLPLLCLTFYLDNTMKKTIFLLCCYWNTALLFAQNVVSPEEQTQIKQVIADEAQAFSNKQYEQWTGFYRQTPQVYFATVEKGKTIQKEGWDNLQAWANTFFHEKNTPKVTYKRDNFSFRKVNPTYIWVTFDQTKTSDAKKEITKELRIVEMIKGEWKMVNRTGFVAGSNSNTEAEATPKLSKTDTKEEKKGTTTAKETPKSKTNAEATPEEHKKEKKEKTTSSTPTNEPKNSSKEPTTTKDKKAKTTEPSSSEAASKPTAEKPKKFFD